jgi:Mrp family chromosome partitioning ATPase
MIARTSAFAPVASEATFEINEEIRHCCRTILNRLSGVGPRTARGLRTVGVTSCSRGEGVSTLAAHLAVTAASCLQGPVALVDCNLLHPAAARLLSVAPRPGLAEYLSSGEGMPEAIQESAIANLLVIAAGERRGSAARAYYSPALPVLVQELARDFQLVVFDMPPAAQASCTSRLAGLLDGVLLVVEAERVRSRTAQRVTELLAHARAHVLGAVLNKGQRRAT